MSSKKKICVGSRKSELALIQTRHVIGLLKNLHPDLDFEIVTMNTLGDKVLDIPLPKIGEKSLFTKELEAALLNGSVDFVVHSLKDLPTTLPPGMAIGAVLVREDPRDALVLQKDIKNSDLDTLPKDSVIGTSSLRRTAQLARRYPHLKIENIRGNLNTRLKKLDDLGKYQAIVLAAAGLVRMGWNSRISKIIDSEDMLYAVGQGALAVECREDDSDTIELLSSLYDLQTALRVISERSLMRTLGGGCSAPVAVRGDLQKLPGDDGVQYRLDLVGAVWSLDGKDELMESGEVVLDLPFIQRCATCPFSKTRAQMSIEDIECIDQCIKCPNSPAKVPTKKAKIEIPSEVLKDDPHEKCPIQMPVGSDFMGKCPFLEAGHKEIPPESFKQCPFMRSREDVKQEGCCKEAGKESDRLFCGLVPHKAATLETMRAALDLGKGLAEKLIRNGALEIMAKAQNTIHASIEQSPAVGSGLVG